MSNFSVPSPKITKQEVEKSNMKSSCQQYKDYVSTLPTVDGLAFRDLYLHDNWYVLMVPLIGTLIAQQEYQATPNDILLATVPKSGTTWLKALLYATVNRNSTPHSDPNHPLITLSPHQCVPFLEVHLANSLDSLQTPLPKLLGTHIPFHSLPNSVTESGSRIVYLCRNPKDTFVSLWHFVNKERDKNGDDILSLQTGFDLFCNGKAIGGPYWDHVLGYWNASLERPDNVLFVKYEELKEDPEGMLKKIAEFVGFPFTDEEVKNGVVEGIISLCKFDSLKNAKGNKSGKFRVGSEELDTNVFFRRGEVGDWLNHLPPSMSKIMDDITESRFAGSGLNL